MTGDGAQYVLPQGAAKAGEALADELRIEQGRSHAAQRTFYDTFDGRLHAAGLVLLHADGRLALVDAVGYEERAGVDASEEPPARLLPIEMEAGPLRDALVALVDVRALTPIARIRSRLRPLRVLNDDAKTVVRMVVEAPVTAGGRRLAPRLHVVPVRGYAAELEDVRHRLENGLGVTAAERPLHDEAVAAAGGTPGGVSSKPAFSLRAEQPAAAAAATMFAGLLRVIEANVPGTLEDVDSEFLHDLRVAVRRTRSLQRQLAAELPDDLPPFRAEFRRLQQVTGPSRDLDVYVLDFDDFRATAGEDLDPLRGLLEERRRREHARMGRALRSERTRRLLADWAAFLATLEGGRPIGEVAGERIGKVYRRMVKAGRAIDDASPAEALHDLRKQGKELRYLLEFFASLYPDKVIRPMVKTLKALQDTLGRFQDREVQADTLRALREDVVALEDGAAALMAMGLLVEHLERDQVTARTEFAERFAAFSGKDQRALVRKTFA
jgi:CHAD domain-containing protein